MKHKTEIPLNPDGLVNLICGLFRQTAAELEMARTKGNTRQVHDITRFYLSPWCRYLVESSGGDYNAFLEAKGLRGRGDSGGDCGA